MKTEILLVFLSLVVLFCLAIALSINPSNIKCISGHYEKYYDTSGTALFAATKNAGMLAMNGWKERFICDVYEKPNL